MSLCCLITGATGFLGGHLAEAAVQRGWTVRTLARASSDTALLSRLPVTIVRGDLGDGAAVAEALQGVEVVFHCAAKVGDWGPVQEYHADNDEATLGYIDACRSRPLNRFVYFSSLGVYAARHHYGTDETEPLPAQHVDGYTQTKVEAEQLVLRYYVEHQLPVVVLRPGFIYGPRDRIVLPKLLDNLHQGNVRYLGDGQQAMNTIYAGNLVDAAFLAAEKPDVVGQVFNLTDGEHVSKRRFIETLADGMGVPKPAGSVPLWVARLAAWWLESRARKRGDPQPPRLTQGRLKFLGLNLDFSIEKAKRLLGYQPRVTFADGMRQTIDWLKRT